MPAEADLLGIVGAEFVAEKLAIRGAPRLHFAIHDRQRLAAECTAGRQISLGKLFPGDVCPGETLAHLSSLTPFKNPVLSRAVVLADPFTADRSKNDTLLIETA
jgi:hypothetical protein